MNAKLHRLLKLGCFLTLLVTLTSCLKEHDHNCPPESGVTLTVKDKNYSNASAIPGITVKDEQLPLNQYVSNFSYRLAEFGTEQPVDSLFNYGFSNGEKSHPIDFSDIPSGKYVLTTYGNVSQNFSKPDASPGSVYILHPQGQEGDDLYVSKDTFQLGSSSPYTIYLTRAKGALLVQIENLPDTVTRIDETIDNIYTEMSDTKLYSNPGSVTKSFTIQPSDSVSLFTAVAPTVSGRQSSLRLAFYSSKTMTPYMYISNISLIAKRNEVTAFKFSFKPEGGVEVWISMNGYWTKLHDLNIDLI